MRHGLRFAAAAGAIALAGALPAAADGPVLILSAYSPEQAVLLQAAGVDGPEDELAVFNGRRFFRGRIAGHDVVLGLTGIGLVDAEDTTREALAWFDAHGVTLAAILFSGVAGGPNLGDVVIPDRWVDAQGSYPVDGCLYAVAEGLRDVPLDPYLPVEDVACTGREDEPPRTPLRVETDPRVIVGGLGHSADPFNGRAVPCFAAGPALLGCEACGAPLDPSPDPTGSGEDVVPFLDPIFYLDLLEYFGGGAPPLPGDPIVVDMETVAVARLAEERGIPFLALRAVSDGGGDPIFASAILGFPVQFFLYQQLAADNAAAVALELLERWQAPELAVSPVRAVVRAGRQQAFAARPGCLAGSDVLWSVQEPDGGSVDASGVYTAPPVLNASRLAHVVARLASDPAVQAVATVELRQNAGGR